MKKNIEIGIIGSTGFIGNSITKQVNSFLGFNTKNLDEILNYSFEKIYIAAPYGLKFLMNKKQIFDLNSFIKIVTILEKVKVKKIVLISSSAVYYNNFNVNEKTRIIPLLCENYGRNRALFENYISNKFNSLIMRLPSIFGEGLKKNFIYDIINKDYRFLPNLNSTYQFYNIDRFILDEKIADKNKISILNCVSEPIVLKKIYKKFISANNMQKLNNTRVKIEHHNIKSLHAKKWGSDHSYLFKDKYILEKLYKFIKKNINK